MFPETLSNLEFLSRNLDVPVPEQINLHEEGNEKIGWGLVFVLLNPKGEILLLTEKRNSEHSHNKAGLLSVIYETGKDETLRSAMIGGVGGEIGTQCLSLCHYDPNKIAEYDFHKDPNKKDKASRSIIIVGYYESMSLPKLNDENLEATDVCWISPEELVNFEPGKVRENLLEIIQLLSEKGWLNLENAHKMPVLKESLDLANFLKERDSKPDLRYI